MRPNVDNRKMKMTDLLDETANNDSNLSVRHYKLKEWKFVAQYGLQMQIVLQYTMDEAILRKAKIDMMLTI